MSFPVVSNLTPSFFKSHALGKEMPQILGPFNVCSFFPISSKYFVIKKEDIRALNNPVVPYVEAVGSASAGGTGLPSESTSAGIGVFSKSTISCIFSIIRSESFLQV